MIRKQTHASAILHNFIQRRVAVMDELSQYAQECAIRRGVRPEEPTEMSGPSQPITSASTHNAFRDHLSHKALSQYAKKLQAANDAHYEKLELPAQVKAEIDNAGIIDNITPDDFVSIHSNNV
jgi:hypothetical protein